MSKILVTGGTGFIGRACLDALSSLGWEIHAIYRNRPCLEKKDVIWYEADILQQQTVTDLVKKISPDYLLHLAWIVDHQLCWHTEQNINYIFATAHLYKEFSLCGGKKAVLLGTGAEYDKTFSICSEQDTPLKPDSLYGLCKKQTFELISQLKLNNPHYSPFLWMRIFNIYGFNEYHKRLIPYIFSSYLRGEVPILNSPNAIRDHIFVEDAAKIITYFLKDETVSAINVGSGTVLSILELAQYIHWHFFKDQPPPKINSQTDNNQDTLIPKLDRLNMFNLQPSLSFERSLEKTYQWWLKNIGYDTNILRMHG